MQEGGRLKCQYKGGRERKPRIRWLDRSRDDISDKELSGRKYTTEERKNI